MLMVIVMVYKQVGIRVVKLNTNMIVIIISNLVHREHNMNSKNVGKAVLFLMQTQMTTHTTNLRDLISNIENNNIINSVCFISRCGK